MDKDISEWVNDLESSDDKTRMSAFQNILRATEEPVTWVYDIWDRLLKKLEDENSYQRSIAVMMLCNLAKSDTEHRLEKALDRLLAHTKDEKFITSRQCIQNIWKAASTSPTAQKRILDHLVIQFRECGDQKHSNLIRQDIIQSIRCLYEDRKDATLLAMAQALIRAETNEKYRRKYEAILAG